MAESNTSPMSMDSFRSKRAASTTPKSAGGGDTKSKAPSGSKRPASASGSGSRRSASVENVSNSNLGASREKSASSISLAERNERVRVLREKQVEDRKKKNEERRLAFEERKRKKMEEEKARWEDLKARLATNQSASSQGLGSLRPGTGRKLPSVPSAGPQKRPASASASPSTTTRPSSLPKQQRAASASTKRSPSATNLKSPSQSSPSSSVSPSVSSESSPHQSPASTPSSSQSRNSIGKASSTSHLPGTGRRGSTGLVHLQSSSTSKSRPRSIHGLNPQKQALGPRSTSHDSLSLMSSWPLAKSHSTSALNQLHTSERTARRSFSSQKPGSKGESQNQSKPTSHVQKPKHKPEPKPHAGLTDEKAAKEALAERRRQAREEAERQAALDKEKAEQECIRKEEEERIRKEEEAKEEARQRELSELLRQQEEERFKKAMKEAEKRAKEEAEQLAAEQKRKEEEKKQKEEEDRIARELAELKAKEEEERRKLEEAERNERRKRVEMIMSRTRQTAGTTQITPKETKELDPEGTKRKVDEILQKAKDRSGSKAPLNSTATAQNNEETTPGKQGTVAKQIEDVLSSINQTFGVSEKTETGVSVNGDAGNLEGKTDLVSSTVSETDSTKLSDNIVEHSLGSRTCTVLPWIPSIQIDEPPEDSALHEEFGMENTKQRTTVSGEYSEETIGNSCSESASAVTNGNSTDYNVFNCYHGGANGTHVAIEEPDKERTIPDQDEDELWCKTESIMRSQKSKVVEALENAGIVAEGGIDNNGDEEELWRVVEGKTGISVDAV